MDVSEIGLEPPTRQVSQGDERLPMLDGRCVEHVALHLGIPAAVAVLVAEASEELERRCAVAWAGRFRRR